MLGFGKSKANPNPIDTIKVRIKQKFANSLDNMVNDPKASEESTWHDSGTSIEEFKKQYTMLVDNMLDRVDKAEWYDNAYSLTASADAPVGDHQISRKDVMKALYYYAKEEKDTKSTGIPMGKYKPEEWTSRGNITQGGSRALFNSFKFFPHICFS